MKRLAFLKYRLVFSNYFCWMLRCLKMKNWKVILKKSIFWFWNWIFVCRFSKMLQKDLLKVELKFLLWVSLHFWLFIKSLNLIGLETFSKFGFLGLPFWFHFYAMMSIWQKLLNLHRFLKSVWIFFCECWIFVFDGRMKDFKMWPFKWKLMVKTLPPNEFFLNKKCPRELKKGQNHVIMCECTNIWKLLGTKFKSWPSPISDSQNLFR